MQSEIHERALAVFEAFLHYVRDPSSPAPPPRVTTARAPTPTAPVPRVLEDDTRPSLVLPPPGTGAGESDDFADTPTRESHLPEAIASDLSPRSSPEEVWDEPTRERPGLVQELRARDTESTKPDVTPPAPTGPRFDPLEGVVPERSIIVDEDAVATEPLAVERLQLRGGAAEARAEQFVQEMTVLIKYGHADQVPREMERWLRAYPDELSAHARLAEFELTRLDAAAGLDRLLGIAARALDRAQTDLAERVLERVMRDAPGDMRAGALRERLRRSRQ